MEDKNITEDSTKDSPIDTEASPADTETSHAEEPPAAGETDEASEAGNAGDALLSEARLTTPVRSSGGSSWRRVRRTRPISGLKAISPAGNRHVVQLCTYD